VNRNNTFLWNNVKISNLGDKTMKKVDEQQISNNQLTKMLNKSIGLLMENFVKIALRDFSSAKSLVKIALKQRKTETIRCKYEEEGLHVPPFMIASITSTCNLNCKGCYDKVKIHNHQLELNDTEWVSIFSEARDLGISFILLGGGEPLTRDNVVKACREFPEIIFPVFTNGLLIDEAYAEFFATSRNIIPIVSIEGNNQQTDDRRGLGVFDRVSLSFELLRKRNIFFGTSITLTSDNIDTVLNEAFIQQYMEKGCRVFFFIEYVPFDELSEKLVISEEQRINVDNALNKLRENYKGIFIAFPGDEKDFGGCLAAGRGFVHINSTGSLEACPFAPYSDTNLKNMRLKDALNSPILNEIRDLHTLIKDHKGGCALFDNRELVNKKLNAQPPCI
jgi:MoaA/NifB/PqqE/SkfB family radical SAM enzyme